MTKQIRPPHSIQRFVWYAAIATVLLAAGALTFSMRGVDILGVVAAATSSLTPAPAILYLTPYDDSQLHVGDIKKIDVVVNAKVPINALGATIKFPQDSVEILGFSKEKSFFDLWTEETAINEDTGEIHFSGGTTRSGGMSGTSTVLTLTLRAKQTGTQVLFFKNSEVYAYDGKGTQLDNEVRSYTFDVQPQPIQQNNSVSGGAATISQPERPLPKSADLNGDGLVNLIDMSIMIIHIMMAPYDQRYDLNMDGVINISDLSILLSQVR